MKNVSILVFIVLIVLVLILCSVSFQVRETEIALVKRFGEVSRKIDEPGFYWKWPAPIEKVVPFDSRSQLFVGRMEETTTSGGNNILVTSYIVWKIGDPQKYLEAVKTEAAAKEQLRNYLRDAQNTVIGLHSFSDFVNANVEKVKLASIENQMHNSLKDTVLKATGIDIEVVGIRQLGVSKSVSTTVFERMKEERSRKKELIISEGESKATEIRSDADSKATQLMAVVNSYAKAIRGEGDAEAAKHYKKLEDAPELALYLQEVETLMKIFEKDTTIILDSEQMELINLLKGVQDIKPADGPEKNNY